MESLRYAGHCLGFGGGAALADPNLLRVVLPLALAGWLGDGAAGGARVPPGRAVPVWHSGLAFRSGSFHWW